MTDSTHKPRYEVRAVTAMHMIHKWSIEHPYTVIAFYTGVVVLAILAIGFYMPRRMMPYVESPLVGVVTMMPGLSAEEMEMYISKPIEESLVNVKKLHFIRSTSQDGISIVTLEFFYGQDMKKALFDVQALMNVVQSNLPATGANLKPSWVLAIDPLNIPILSLSVTSDKMDPVKLREFADNEVVNRLKELPSVYSVVPFGGYRRQLQVIVDRDKLAAYKLSILDVKNAIDRYNVSRPGGTLTHQASESIVRVDTRALDAKTVMNYPIAAVSPSGGVKLVGAGGGGGGMGSGGMGAMGGGASASSPTQNPQPTTFSLGPAQSPRIVYVRDVARVEDTHWERRSAYHYVSHDPGREGKIIPSIEVSVIQDPGASSAKVVPQVQKVLRRLEKDYPGVKFDVAYDNAHFVNILFENMLHELGMAIVLTGIALLLFLGEWRGTLISMISIPLSLAMAILGLVPLGFTLNSGTLIGLLLSIGRLVDDSIIDIHAVERHLRMGKDPKTATIDGIAEVRLAVIASTLMLVMALSPLLVCGGITQLMFKELVWPIIFGLMASMLVSFTMTALLCANLLRTEEDRDADLKFAPYRFLHTHVLARFQRSLDRLEAGYARSIDWMLHNRFWSFARKMFFIIIGCGFYYFIGSEMMPLADVGQAYGLLEMQPGASFEETERATTAFEKILLKHPEIEKVSTEIGQETMFESFSPLFTGYAMPSVQAANMMLTFSDKDDREKTIWQVMDAAQKEAMDTIPGIRRLQIKEMGSDVMATSAAPVALVVYGKDLNLLDKMGHEVLKIAQETKGMYQPALSWTMGKPDYEIQVDTARAQEVGLTPEEISQQAYYAMRGGLTNEFYRLPNLRQNTILVRYDQDDRKNSQDLESMYLTTSDGRQIPLKSVATLKLRRAPTVIEHDNLRRVNSLLGYYRIGGPPSMDLGMKIQMDAMQKINFPPGYGIDVRGDMTQMMDSFRRLLNGLLLAVLFMFLVLVAQFRGFIQPFQMIFSLPLELTGVFVALWLAHQNFSSVSILAVIVLSGMDVTTAVLMIDMIMRYRDRGVPRDQAIIEACPQRLRPILMTSIITIIVMIPVAFFPKTGLDAYQPLGTTILGGLIVGTVLSLLDIPIIHTYIDDFLKWSNRTFLNREWEWPVTAQPEEEAISE